MAFRLQNLMFSEEAAPAAIHRDILAKNAVFYKKTKQIKKKAIRLSFFLNLMFSEEAAPATIHREYFSKKCYNLQENKPK